MKWFNAPFSYLVKHGLSSTAPLKERWDDALRDPIYVIALAFALAVFIFALSLII